MSWLLGHVNSDDEEETKGVQKAAEGEQEPVQDKEESGFTSFWGALNTLKTKSLSAIETTKKDFTEFGSAFSNETKEIREEVTEVFKSKTASENADAAPTETESQPSGPGVLARAEEKLTDNLEKISQGVENLAEKVWGGAVTFLPSIFGMSGIEENVENDKGGRLTKEQELKALQSNSLTYSGAIEPENTEAFEKLTQDFADRYDSFWGQEVTKMLGNPLVRAHYDQLVPEVISEDAFWCHYVFRKRALEQKHERKQQLESRLAQTNSDDDSFADLAWDDDDEPAHKHQPSGHHRSDSNANDLSGKSPRTPPPTPFTSSDARLETPLPSSMEEGSLFLPSSLSADSSPTLAASSEPSVSSLESSSQAVSEMESADQAKLSSSTSTLAETCTSPSACPDVVSSSPPASPTMLPLDSPASFTAVPSEPSLTRKDSSSSSSSEPSLVSIPSTTTISPAEGETVAVMHMQREISGSPETSDSESQRLPPSLGSDSEPWEPGVEDAVLKAMCDTPDIAELDGIEGLILVPQGEDADASVPKADDWDQWE